MERLSDDVLVMVISFLSVDDIINLYNVNKRFSNLTLDREIVRSVRLRSCYSVTGSQFQDFVRRSASHVQVLDLNHCYWLPSRVVQAAVKRCQHLTELHVIGCSLSADALAATLSFQSNLVALSFSVVSYLDLSLEKSAVAAAAFRSLQRLSIYFLATRPSAVGFEYLGEHASVLDLCHELKMLKIGAVGVVLPTIFRPIMNNIERFKKIERFVLTDCVHGSAQMFFYAVLSQLPLVDIHWRSLIIPNLNFLSFSRNAQFDGCFKNVAKLQHFCASYSKMFPSQILNLDIATDLRYLNMRGSNVTSYDLRDIALACTKLTALDLFECADVFMRRTNNGNTESIPCTEGLQAVVEKCRNLRRLNMANVHCHDHHTCNICSLLKQLKGLKSLALPACLLSYQKESGNNDEETEMKKGSGRGKRIRLVAPPGDQVHKRAKRISHAKNFNSQGEAGPSSSRLSADHNADEEFCNLLASLAYQSPELEELEILGVGFESFFQSRLLPTARRNLQFNACKELSGVTDHHLSSVCDWTQLTRLTLCAMTGIQHGGFLEKITERCHQLSFLSLAYLGPSGKCVYQGALIRSLQHCRSLRDLRIEQPNLLLNATFFDALQSLHKLQRLCVVARNSKFSSTDVLSSITKMKCLTVLLMFGDATQKQCAKLKKDINAKGFIDKDKRPAFIAAIAPLQATDIADSIKSVPASHYKELLMFGSKVASKPSSALFQE